MAVRRGMRLWRSTNMTRRTTRMAAALREIWSGATSGTERLRSVSANPILLGDLRVGEATGSAFGYSIGYRIKIEPAHAKFSELRQHPIRRNRVSRVPKQP